MQCCRASLERKSLTMCICIPCLILMSSLLQSQKGYTKHLIEVCARFPYILVTSISFLSTVLRTELPLTKNCSYGNTCEGSNNIVPVFKEKAVQFVLVSVFHACNPRKALLNTSEKFVPKFHIY